MALVPRKLPQLVVIANRLSDGSSAPLRANRDRGALEGSMEPVVQALLEVSPGSPPLSRQVEERSLRRTAIVDV